jgi:hypothetical protein
MALLVIKILIVFFVNMCFTIANVICGNGISINIIIEAY